MYFCPKCSYTFDITKKDSNIEIEDNLEDISSVNELLKLVKNNANLKKYKATFDKKVLNSNKRYLKLPDELMADTLAGATGGATGEVGPSGSSEWRADSWKLRWN